MRRDDQRGQSADRIVRARDGRSGSGELAGVACRESRSSPSAVSVVFSVAIPVLALVVFAVGARPRQHREAPLRKQMRAWPQTFQTSVDVRASFLGIMLPPQGRLRLVVRGGAFEVAHSFPLSRFVFGQRYCYRAEDTTIKVVTGQRRDVRHSRPPVAASNAASRPGGGRHRRPPPCSP